MENELKVIVRLNRLMKAGYSIMERDSQELEDTLRLKHPATKRARYIEILLYSDASIVSGLSHLDGHLSIFPEDDEGFRKLIKATPTPTWSEKSEDARVNIAVWLTLGALFAAPIFWGIFKS
ncbi:hypothetical protein [Dasania marina]|uniref:hypothetical protein n=1 Tax=Dasania marina TaxID=471499 RepID=UPI0030DB0342